MAKIETPEKKAARKLREQKELLKWKKEQARPKRKFYLVYLLVVLSLVFSLIPVANAASSSEIKEQIEILEEETDFSVYEHYCEKYRSHLWGTSDGVGFNVDHLEMTLHFEDDEQHIPQRLEREKRNGRVEMVDKNTCKYIVDTYDASEMMPWLRTFIGRIEKLECSDQKVVDKFYEDLEEMYSLYGGEE